MEGSKRIILSFDRAINYAFQQNAIPVIKDLVIRNDDVKRTDLVVRIFTEPQFAEPIELRIQSIEPQTETRLTPLDLKLSHDFLFGLNERVFGWLKVEVLEGGVLLWSLSEAISLLARNEWCGLNSLPEILAAFVLPNDPIVTSLLGRASELLGEHAGRTGLNGYQDKNRKHVWEQVAAIYRAIGELKIRYIVAPASFESTGQKVRFPDDVHTQRFGNCLDLALLFAACCEQAGLFPLVLMHEGHAYAGCWLEERTLREPSCDDLQHIRKLAADELLTVFECTLIASDDSGTLRDAELHGQKHLETKQQFRIALDVRCSRLSKIYPMPYFDRNIPIEKQNPQHRVKPVAGIGTRIFEEPKDLPKPTVVKPSSRIDQWKSRLLDLSLRNRLLNFKETKATVQILCAVPDKVEDELAADRELLLQSKPRLMGEDDPRSEHTYTKQQRAEALLEHLQDELKHGRLHTSLQDAEHSRRLTELYRSARNSIEENGTNTLFLAVGSLEWRETEQSDRVFRAPLLLVPVELKRKSVLEGFSLKRIDEETRLNVTLMEMLRQHFQKSISGLEPLPEDHSGVDVPLVFRIFRDAVRDLAGWEVKTEVWLGQFSFTKFLLWKDLADRLNELTKNRIVHHLVNEAGTPYQNSPNDIRPEKLDTSFHPQDVFCPRSADSSQLAAVMAAAAEQDIVLEGPPGTGKSQTITNIIAHCLATGKRVLFVAEKRAALDVVFRRLREAGLEPFCLELHSNKTGKADVVAQFDRTLKYISSESRIDWENGAAELERLRTKLNAYSQALHHRYASGISAFQCLDYLLPRQSELVLRLDNWNSILSTSNEKIEQARRVAKLLQQRSKPLLPLADHALAYLNCQDWSPTWAERALEQSRELQILASEYSAADEDLRAWLQTPKIISFAQLKSLLILTRRLADVKPVGPSFVTTDWSVVSKKLERWIKLLEERASLRDALEPIFKPGSVALPQVSCEQWGADQAEEVYKKARVLSELTNAALASFQDLKSWLNLPAFHGSRENIVNLVALVDSLSAGVPVPESFATVPFHGWVVEFDQWINWVRERSDLRKRLTDYNEVSLLALDLDSLNEKWKTSAKSWFLKKLILVGNVRRQLMAARLDKSKPSIESLEIVIRSALRLCKLNKDLSDASTKAEWVLGRIWNKAEPDINNLTQVRDWGSILYKQLDLVGGGDENRLSKLREVVGSLFKQGPAYYEKGTRVGDLFLRYREAVTKFDEVYEQITDSANLNRRLFDGSPDHFAAVATALNGILSFALKLRSVVDSLVSEGPDAEAHLGSSWKNGDATIEYLKTLQNWGGLLHSEIIAVTKANEKSLKQVRQVLAAAFSEGSHSFEPGSAINRKLVRFQSAHETFTKAFDAFSSSVNIRSDCFDQNSDVLSSIQFLGERLPAAWPQIRDWCYWQKIRSEGMQLSLGPIIEKLESPGGENFDIAALFERSFRRTFLFAVVESDAALRDFFGREHNELIEQFREIDQKLANLTRILISYRLSAKIPRDQTRHDIPKTEIGLLRREIAKKARHIPVRQLLGRIPNLLPHLKPCVLMSPLSVAQYLEPSHEMFDIVIFDEASQIPVWDAVGAIARGKQLIVVGDPKQLPPTNFFNSTPGEEEELAAEEHKDLESILDELMTNGVRHKRLKWHYRSRHEGLIAFSNRQYYDNDLLTFPSPETGLGGVKFKHLPDARYDKGKSRTNRLEAEALVQELVSRLRDPKAPRRSYGVVTFSLAQQQLVENLLDEERRKFPEIENHFGDEPPVEGEPIFVKNLENVQGDERDVIFFSICYGIDEAGKVSMNFGPLNREGGDRRLNVAITRSKHEMVVFSGLRADNIDLARTRAKGVRDLKYFLDYAERGARALVAATTTQGEAEPDSEFEKMVAERLRKAGFDVHHQIGCSGYRIDLGILDPSKPGRYLLGIECDGATYHRAATARDRDKLRQAILEGLGWTLYRIWSTDWWHDQEEEVTRLLKFISELIKSKPMIGSEQSMG